MSHIRKSSADLISELRALGSMSWHRGDLRRAEQHYRLALNLYDTTFGESHVDAAICLLDLVQVLNESGRYIEAQQLEQQFESLNLRRRSEV